MRTASVACAQKCLITQILTQERQSTRPVDGATHGSLEAADRALSVMQAAPQLKCAQVLGCSDHQSPPVTLPTDVFRLSESCSISYMSIALPITVGFSLESLVTEVSQLLLDCLHRPCDALSARCWLFTPDWLLVIDWLLVL